MITFLVSAIGDVLDCSLAKPPADKKVEAGSSAQQAALLSNYPSQMGYGVLGGAYGSLPSGFGQVQSTTYFYFEGKCGKTHCFTTSCALSFDHISVNWIMHISFQLYCSLWRMEGDRVLLAWQWCQCSYLMDDLDMYCK